MATATDSTKQNLCFLLDLGDYWQLLRSWKAGVPHLASSAAVLVSLRSQFPQGCEWSVMLGSSLGYPTAVTVWLWVLPPFSSSDIYFFKI